MSQKTASPHSPARAKSAGTAPEDRLSSLEAMLTEIASARDARQRLISGATPAEAAPAPATQPEATPAAEPPAKPSPTEDTQIAALHAKIEKARAGLTNRDAHIAKLKGQRDALRTERDALHAELDKMRASRSWRITAPLRRLRGG